MYSLFFGLGRTERMSDTDVNQNHRQLVPKDLECFAGTHGSSQYFKSYFLNIF